MIKATFKNVIVRASLADVVIKFGSLHFVGAGSDPGSRPTPLISHAVEASHIQSRGGLAHILGQG